MDDDRETRDSRLSDQDIPSGKICEYCGTAIGTSDWYPVTKKRNADGSIQLYSFCSDSCQETWLDERSD